MIITFIGNCQLVSLCFFFQELLQKTDNNVYWISYSEIFNRHLIYWSDKCKNKILNYENGIKVIKNSDVIIYQNKTLEASFFCNTEHLMKIKKNTCMLIKLPYIIFDYNDYNNSILELEKRENENRVDLKVSPIFKNYKHYNLMISKRHPKTFLFLRITYILCCILNINFFTKDKYMIYLKNDNYMELPMEL